MSLAGAKVAARPKWAFPRVLPVFTLPVGLPVKIRIQRAAPDEFAIAWEIVSEYYDAARVVARETEATFRSNYFCDAAGVWLAWFGTELCGCVALRALAPGQAEIKRFYLREKFRGLGIAQRLVAAAEAFARQHKYEWIYLDTAAEMHAAARLYQSAGYSLCERYNDNPQAAIFLRKKL